MLTQDMFMKLYILNTLLGIDPERRMAEDMLKFPAGFPPTKGWLNHLKENSQAGHT